MYLRRDLEDDPVSAGAGCRSCAIEIAVAVQNHAVVGYSPIITARELVEQRIDPGARRGYKLKHGAASVSASTADVATLKGRAVELAGRVHSECAERALNSTLLAH